MPIRNENTKTIGTSPTSDHLYMIVLFQVTQVLKMSMVKVHEHKKCNHKISLFHIIKVHFVNIYMYRNYSDEEVPVDSKNNSSVIYLDPNEAKVFLLTY